MPLCSPPIIHRGLSPVDVRLMKKYRWWQLHLTNMHNVHCTALFSSTIPFILSPGGSQHQRRLWCRGQAAHCWTKHEKSCSPTNANKLALIAEAPGAPACLYWGRYLSREQKKSSRSSSWLSLRWNSLTRGRLSPRRWKQGWPRYQVPRQEWPGFLKKFSIICW